MEVNTSIAESIHATDQYAQYDAACKRVLAEKIVLAWIMKSCLKEYQDCCVEEIAEKYIEGTPQVGKVPVLPDETNAPRGASAARTHPLQRAPQRMISAFWHLPRMPRDRSR